jgi:phosphoribosylglycinamide formyltransferase 1
VADRQRIAVFASGGGSNLGALLEYFESLGDARSAAVTLVVSDRAGARALERARHRDIATLVLTDHSDGRSICDALLKAQIDLVVLAGYLKLLPAEVIAGWPRRIVNVHPGPLPRFGGQGMYGRRVHEAVLAAGESHTAVSVHLVDAEYDRGPVIAQWPVEIVPGDTAESLAERVLRAEHVVYPRVVDMLAALTSRQR